jgi:hypothetical protein
VIFGLAGPTPEPTGDQYVRYVGRPKSTFQFWELHRVVGTHMNVCIDASSKIMLLSTFGAKM